MTAVGIDGSSSCGANTVIDSTPAHRLRHSAATSAAPGNRPAMPMIAIGSRASPLGARRVGVAVASPAIARASAAGVGAAKKVAVEIAGSPASRSRVISVSASSELPPSSKNPSSAPTRSRPSRSANTSQIAASRAPLGARYGTASVGRP